MLVTTLVKTVESPRHAHWRVQASGSRQASCSGCRLAWQIGDRCGKGRTGKGAHVLGKYLRNPKTCPLRQLGYV